MKWLKALFALFALFTQSSHSLLNTDCSSEHKGLNEAINAILERLIHSNSPNEHCSLEKYIAINAISHLLKGIQKIYSTRFYNLIVIIS